MPIKQECTLLDSELQTPIDGVCEPQRTCVGNAGVEDAEGTLTFGTLVSGPIIMG